MDWQTADAGGTHVPARDADFATERSSAGGTESPLRRASATVFGAIQGPIDQRSHRRGYPPAASEANGVIPVCATSRPWNATVSADWVEADVTRAGKVGEESVAKRMSDNLPDY